MAFDAFVQGVAAYCFNDAISAVARRDAADELFQEHSQLATMIDRLTYIGAAEIFLGRETSLLKPLQSKGIEKIVIATVVERQKKSLEESKWKRKVQRVLMELLDDLVSLYDATEYPIRRARVIVWKLELACSSNEGSEDVEALAKEALDALMVDVSLRCLVTCNKSVDSVRTGLQRRLPSRPFQFTVPCTRSSLVDTQRPPKRYAQ